MHLNNQTLNSIQQLQMLLPLNPSGLYSYVRFISAVFQTHLLLHLGVEHSRCPPSLTLTISFHFLCAPLTLGHSQNNDHDCS